MNLASAAPDLKFATVLLLDRIGLFALEIQEFLLPFGSPSVLCAYSFEEFSAALTAGGVELAIIGAETNPDDSHLIARAASSHKVPTLWLSAPDMVRPAPTAPDISIDFPFSLESFRAAFASALALSNARQAV